MRFMIAFIYAGVLIVSLEASAQAGIIYDNGPFANSAFASDFAVNNQIADDFILTDSSTVTDVHWWGNYLSETPEFDNFTIRIFADAGSEPVATPLYEIAIGNVSRTPIPGPDIHYEYSAFIGPVTLDINTVYWLSIVNDTSGNPPGSWWAWDSTLTTKGSLGAFRFTDSDEWLSPHFGSGGVAFQLTDDAQAAVPEPASVILWLVGLTCGAGWLRRQRQSLQVRQNV